VSASARDVVNRHRHGVAMHPTRLSTRLNRDWDHLRRSRTARRTAQNWNLPIAIEGPHQPNPTTSTPATSDDVLDRILQATRQSEPLLYAILQIARDDDLAARLVLQRLLPGLLVSAQRSRSDLHPERFDDLMSAAWLVIRTYNFDRRPSCLAAAIIRSSEHLAYKAAARRRSSSEICSDRPEELGSTASSGLDDPATTPSCMVYGTDPLFEFLDVVREATTNGLDEDDLGFVRRLVNGASTTVLAQDFGVTSRTIRNRRHAVAMRIRHSVLATD